MDITHQIIRLTAVDSTNEFAKKIVLPKSDTFISVIVADEQSAGRGQRGNSWHSEKGKNLLMSLCFSPTFLSIDNRFYLSKITSIAVFDVLQTYHVDFKIKWPNDLIFGKQKIGGILIENTISGAGISQAVIGLGLNINQTKFPEYLPDAVSLKNIINRELNLDDVLERIINSFKKYYLLLKNNCLLEIDRRYYSNLFRLNVWADYRDSQGTFRGKIRGTNPDGRLLVLTETGEIKKYDFKEIVFF
jgi:BirA family biotin operon repressor/biotin-[acetyl-CoA-carboxylase] ligase